MVKPSKVPDSSMEDILASIRGILSDGKSDKSDENPTTNLSPEDDELVNNISRLFESDLAETSVSETDSAAEFTEVEQNSLVQAGEEAGDDLDDGEATFEPDDDVIDELADSDADELAGAMPDDEEFDELTDSDTDEVVGIMPDDAANTEDGAGDELAAAMELPPVEPEQSPPGTEDEGWLLSPPTDAETVGAYNELADAAFAENSRTVDQMAEEIMRPMLRDWLDENLPPLVERLVREEIERVSRRR